MPSGHSSSSHSSHSSSSHSSSFSSRSSGSSRSYSSSSSRGPSSHSSSSWSSRPSSSFGSSSSRPSSRPAPSTPPMRPRVNQPSGFRPFGGMAPRYVYGRRHDYVYYPVAWVDNDTGRSYEKGYYDENGQHYDDVSFKNDGKYKNVVCHCSYCDKDTIIDLSAEDAASKSLQCPSCGAPMVVNSFLDDYVTGTDSRPASDSRDKAVQRSDRRNIGCLIALAIFLAIGIISCVASDISDSHSGSGYSSQQVYTLEESSNVDLFGETVLLTAGEDGGYRIGEGSGTADKVMVWSAQDDSYYDESSQCWVWYNTDMDPPVWQYWYEGISSDYGDYGWMEHDDDGWYIEKDHGEWIKLPSKYGTDGLWYIED